MTREGEDVCLIGLGSMHAMAERAAEILEAQGVSVAVINPRWIKPMDTALLERYGRKCRVLCTLEDHVLAGGFGSGVIEHLHSAGIYTPVERIAWPDAFVEHGKPSILREKHGMTAENCAAKVLAQLHSGEPALAAY